MSSLSVSAESQCDDVSWEKRKATISTFQNRSPLMIGVFEMSVQHIDLKTGTVPGVLDWIDRQDIAL